MDQPLVNCQTQMINLLGLTPQQLRELLLQMDEKPFHAYQLIKWIHQRAITDFSQMTDLSEKLRNKLSAIAGICAPQIVYQGTAQDGTLKWVLQLADDNLIEMVMIPSEQGQRRTLCVSSQVGCMLNCSFCSTGKQGFARNLNSAEIIAQLWIATHSNLVKSDQRKTITNVVLMGMGEPLLNFDAVLASLQLMLDSHAYGLSKRRVTLSTSGVVPMIDRLGGLIDVSLAVSLHAPNDQLRNQLVPLNRKYPIAELISACQRYLKHCNDSRFITIEYVLISQINDQQKHAQQLATLLKDLPCKINLIPFNPFPGTFYQRPSRNQTLRFQNWLYKLGYHAPIRMPRGGDIDAACGQLVGRVKDRTHRQARYRKIVSSSGT